MSKEAKEKEPVEEEFFLQRKLQLSSLDPKILYPHKFEVTHSVQEAKKIASSCAFKEIGTEVVSSAGRVVSIRDQGKVMFITIESDLIDIQLLIKGSKEIIEAARILRRGDIVGATGPCGRSMSGEPSIFVSELRLLAPCMHVIPSVKNIFSNPNVIYRKRYLDLITNKESRQRFIDRTRIVQYIRNYLVSEGFLEVETPMMSVIHGGAAAKPFKTFHEELKLDLFLRVAPELYLKQLVIGGLNRVFEIGRQFRNEGIDLTHNPEFTSVEFYQAYSDYNDMMRHVEDMLHGLAMQMKGSAKFLYSAEKHGTDEVVEAELDFSKPFAKLDILDELNKVLGLSLDGEKLKNPAVVEELIKVADSKGLEIDQPRTLNRVLDKFIGEYIEPKCVNPTFLTGFPVVTSPLAKDDRKRPGLTERFELFVNGKELCNAYTELNVPSVQRERFLLQSADAIAGDEEAMPVDEDFCQALEYALPPTGGCGIGIDRLVMYFTDAANIRDVILFPTMRPENHDAVAKE